MADRPHPHDLECVTDYGNGFGRYQCRVSGCDYWTDGKVIACESCARLRAALQTLADAADAQLHEPNWIPLINARRLLNESK